MMKTFTVAKTDENVRFTVGHHKQFAKQQATSNKQDRPTGLTEFEVVNPELDTAPGNGKRRLAPKIP